ncbi:uncharacterized protein BJ212DRAFT_1475570 [Suillus subaureus]|uniref:C3H1-type domain-containing protein n=1 Tax=Suillus subaureus TaxID=48587 RepID=A0A9P7JJK9_9AGAM|nr:uncharacterized protein BJ212DRAFT_1475570 [Suillus subaureus]KAG1826240.1 hypothetical protein BJ212DRAFT_1475570 [Suillus subaureus]
MQKVVTATTAPTHNLYFARESGSRKPISARAQSTGAPGWSQIPLEHHNLNPDFTVETWNVPSAQDSPPSLSSYIPRPASIQKPLAMPVRTNLVDMSKTETSGHPSERVPNNAQRWRLNGSGQLVDPDASLDWDLAQDIARLKLGAVGDLGDDIQGRLGTSPQSKLGAANVAPFNDASPLETASDVSLDSSPNTSDHQISPSHSRVSSTDTLESHESAISSASHTMRGQPQLKIATGNEGKERPHSFSGGLSTADLRRLKQAGEEHVHSLPAHPWSSATYRDRVGSGEKPFSPEQPQYPSLTNASFGRGQQQFDYRSAQGNGDLQGDYGPQRSYFPQPSAPSAAAPQHFLQGRPANGVQSTYRQPQRGYPPQPLVPSPTGLAYGPAHVPHLSLGNTQQLYDMVLPTGDSHHPAVTRVQQQHNVFRGAHQHSASDPSALRDAATLALLSNQAVFAQATHGMYPPIHPGLYNQFYGTPESYPSDLAVAAMASRLQTHFTSPYGVLPAQGLGGDHSNPGSESPLQNTGGPSANNRKLGLYKTELCRSWEEKGSCRYGAKCQFAHGEDELRNVARHPKYKTEICRTFWVSGACPYGKRCCFIHTELPVSGIAPGAEGVPPPSATASNRERSNSDPNESSISLLQRIQRKGDATPVDASPPSGNFFNSRPPTGSLRVDTSALNNITKQNKSAYPTFASNALMLSSSEQTPVKSPVVPLTAGPDLGRHNNARLDIVGYSQQRLNRTSVTTPNARHSFNGTDVDLDFSSPSTPSAVTPTTSFALSQADRVSNNNAVPRAHVRSGSAGNWGSVTRSSNLAGVPSYPQASGAGESNSPWALAGDITRLGENWM